MLMIMMMVGASESFGALNPSGAHMSKIFSLDLFVDEVNVLEWR